MTLDARVPAGPIEDKWSNLCFHSQLVNPSNKRKFKIIVVGTGLAGASASAALAELGYDVHAFTFHGSPRRAHSIAAQGGINAAKNYQNDGDSVSRLFYDTVKGGDFRAREANVYRLAEVSVKIIDHCVALGVPFAREYGGLLDNRSFGGAQVSRTFYARGQTGQQLLLGAYSSMMRQVSLGTVRLHVRKEFQDLVLIYGKARGIIVRDLITGALERHAADAVILATGGYGRVFFLSTNASGCNVSAAWQCYKRGAYFANPCFTQIHPTCIPVSGEHQSKLTLMSESLRNDGRMWVPRQKGDARLPERIPESERLYFLEEKYPSFGNLVPRDVASRNAKQQADAGHGVGASGFAVYLDLRDAIERQGRKRIDEKYGNLIHMYAMITGKSAYETPFSIYPASHYAMGGLWVDYNLMSTIPGLHVLGEANFSDHGANRLGASALMQGLADGFFVIPYTLGHYFAGSRLERVTTDHPAFGDTENDVRQRIRRLCSVKGTQPASFFHRKLGHIMWDKVGMSRTQQGLREALDAIPKVRSEFWSDLRVPGSDSEYNQQLGEAARVADFLEFAELLALDALTRNESCGAHFREEHQTADGEAKRDDSRFCLTQAWEFTGENGRPGRHVEPLKFETVPLTQRNYK
jgi:succinate dehydrogenase / fumarate reductase, flavoprotein subunit